jgi:glyoxylase-like metal-dependent hydrolase (beta-lactamase superfamily II)
MIKQITDKIFQIDLGAVNAYLIEDGDLTLVDTGFPGSMSRIFSDMKNIGKDPSRIKRIILTHAHADHAGSAAEIQKALDIPIITHPINVEFVENGKAAKEMHLTSGVMNWIIYQLFVKNASKTIDPATVQENVQDNDIIPVAGGIKVIHTPGHCAGHIALLVKSENLLIAGDICSNTMGLDYALLYEDKSVGKQSLLKVSDNFFEKAVFGHGKAMLEKASEKIKAKFSIEI